MLASDTLTSFLRRNSMFGSLEKGMTCLLANDVLVTIQNPIVASLTHICIKESALCEIRAIESKSYPLVEMFFRADGNEGKICSVRPFSSGGNLLLVPLYGYSLCTDIHVKDIKPIADS